jgi:DNA-binding transcriptional regulator YdaS (Cro superfamily)
MAQRELARRVGISSSSISRFLSGDWPRFAALSASAIEIETGGEVDIHDLLRVPYPKRRR